MSFKTGILIDSLQIPSVDAIEVAVESGADGIQFYAAPHHMAFRQHTKEEMVSIANLARENGLEISALCGDLGSHGFERSLENEEKIPKFREIIDIAEEIGVPIITTHIGVVPHKPTETRRIMVEALRELCGYAGPKGIMLAVETGPEPSEVLKAFIHEVGMDNLKINLDPANFVMVQNESPAHAVEVLGDLIVHTHAKDGIHHRDCDAKAIYDAFAEGNPDHIDIDSYFSEVPIGTGEVDWDSYLKALRKIGYEGYLTIEREAGNTRIEDVKKGLTYLKNW